MRKISRLLSRRAATMLIFIVNPAAPVTASDSLEGSQAREDHANFPVTPFQVLGGFDPPEVDWQPGHRGIDLAAQIGHAVSDTEACEERYAGMVAEHTEESGLQGCG